MIDNGKSLVANHLIRPGLTLTSTGLNIEDDPSFDDCMDVGRRLHRMDHTVRWAIGGLLSHDEAHFGDMREKAAARC